MSVSKELITARSFQTPELRDMVKAVLRETKDLDVALDIRSKAKSIEQYIKAAGHSRKAAKEMAEIRLRAERKVGELLIESAENGERATAARGRPEKALQTATLFELGIERTQSHRYQQIAQVPVALFEKYIQESGEQDELTTSGLINLGRLEDRRDLAEEIRRQPPPLPGGRFPVIVIDPPWPYASRADDPTHRSRNPYPDMTLDDICCLPVADLATADAIVWLWTTNAFIWDAKECLDVWGFQSKTILTWTKNQMGTGDWLRGSTEHCLLAVRGRPVVTLTNQRTGLIADRSRHSEKPQEFYNLVDSLCPGAKLEMFARSPREGWIGWGAELAAEEVWAPMGARTEKE